MLALGVLLIAATLWLTRLVERLMAEEKAK